MQNQTMGSILVSFLRIQFQKIYVTEKMRGSYSVLLILHSWVIRILYNEVIHVKIASKSQHFSVIFTITLFYHKYYI